MRAALEREHLGELGFGGLGRRVGREVLARRHDVLGRHEDEGAAESLGLEEPHAFPGHEEVTRRVHGEGAVPLGQAHLVHGRGMGDPRVRDHDVHAAVGEHGLLEAGAHGRLAGHVHADADG